MRYVHQLRIHASFDDVFCSCCRRICTACVMYISCASTLILMTCFAAHYAPSENSEQWLASPVVLRYWCFVHLQNDARKHLGFRVIGALVAHPKIHASHTGKDWFSSEIRRIYSDRVVASGNSTLYRLEGPAAPARHNAHSRLVDIMQPFCQSIWPPNAKSVLNEVSKFFSGFFVFDTAVAGTAQRTRIRSASPSDVHQLRFHAFMMTCFAAAVAGSAQRTRIRSASPSDPSDVHQLHFHAFMMTCFAAAVAGSAQRTSIRSASPSDPSDAHQLRSAKLL